MASNNQSWPRLAAAVKRIFARREDPEMRQVVETLQQAVVFRGLPKSVLTDLAHVVHRRSYRRDEIIYYANDPGLGLYAVRSGRIRLLAEDSEGNVHELRQVGEGELFGKLSLLGDFRRIETAQAVTDAKVLGLFRPDLKTIVKRHPASGAAVLQAIARNVAATEEEFVRLLIEEHGKIEALRLVDGAGANVDRTDANADVNAL